MITVEAGKEFQRKIYKKLLNWKSTSQGRESVLIEGARRVGKSTVAEMFARNEYDSYILIDFSKVSKAILAAFDYLDNLGFLSDAFASDGCEAISS